VSEKLRVLILGGYGTFGGRLATLLAGEAALALVIAGRSAARAAEFCARLPPGAGRAPAAFDRDADVESQLRVLAPHIVVDATGPFQSYGDDPYRVVEAAIALGIDYLDLADGAKFVQGIARFDAAARARAVFVLAGASSFPVLTAAVVRRLAGGLARIETISGGIAPSPYAGVGLNVIRAVAGYAGKPVALRRDAAPAVGYALVESRRYTIAPPGCVPLRRLRYSLVDVPDLSILPAQWPDLRSAWVGVGPVPSMLHRALSMLAQLVRLGLLPSLAPFARLFHRIINVLRWGEHRGGMFVAVTGRRSDGGAVARSWHLLAEGDDGPLIPAMAAEAIVRRCLAGRRPIAGARPAADDLDLADYDLLFARRAIVTGTREDAPEKRRWPLYRRVLGDAFDALPEALRAMHDRNGDFAAEGRATIEGGRNPLARLVAAIFRFPRAGRDVPVAVTFRFRDGSETWRRDFAGRRFRSIQSEGTGRFERLLVERFGPFRFGLALVVDGGRLRLVPRCWSFLGIAMPRFLIPRGDSHEAEESGRFHFHVEIRLPLAGLIVRYRGWLAPSR
jgi:hypothetical protein